MADKTVTSVALTEDQRKQIANDLGLSHNMARIPEKLTILGVKTADLGGALPANPQLFIAHLM